MRIPGVKTLKHFSRWLQARILGGALILGYHRVADVTQDVYEICVTPRHFAEQMEALSKVARPVGLRELVECLKSGSVPPKAVAVTFDDGYVDSLYEAKPILERYAVPATIFVCTGYAGKEFWWDELDRLVKSSQAELGALRLEVGKKPFLSHQLNGSLKAGLESRGRFRQALYHFLLALDADEQEQAMASIRNWSGVVSNEMAARTMTHNELVQLAVGRLIDIGAHTRFHPMLPWLPLERQREEIVSSKYELEGILGRKVDGFAYPNGRATDDAKRIVREAGFTHACTSLQDVVRPASDLHELTRFWQKDVDGDRFIQGLRLWMKGD
jgi:peptidoglycan/xylan/chitin deacetylase (PgdA/CDA1 family)